MSTITNESIIKARVPAKLVAEIQRRAERELEPVSQWVRRAIVARLRDEDGARPRGRAA